MGFPEIAPRVTGAGPARRAELPVPQRQCRPHGLSGLSWLSQGAGEHCYYQGRVRGRPRSFAALSSCQGLQ